MVGLFEQSRLVYPFEMWFYEAVDKESAQNSNCRAAQNVERPVDAGEDSRKAHDRGKREIPPTETAIVKENCHRHREEERGVPRRESITRFAHERR